MPATAFVSEYILGIFIYTRFNAAVEYSAQAVPGHLSLGYSVITGESKTVGVGVGVGVGYDMLRIYKGHVK